MSAATPPQRIDETVTFSIGLDTVIGHEPERDIDGDYIGHHPITLGETIANVVAHKLAEQLYREHSRNYTSLLADTVQAQADRIVEEKIRGLLDQPIKLTNSYGEGKGEAVTLTELIAQRAEAWLNGQSDKNRGYGDRLTNLQKIIDEAIGRSFTNEVSKVVADAKQKAVTTVAQQAASAMAKALGQSTVVAVKP